MNYDFSQEKKKKALIVSTASSVSNELGLTN